MSLAYPQQLRSILLSLVLLGVFVPYVAYAALEVTFEAAPLFVNANVLPGDAVTRTVIVTNTGPDAEEVIFSLENTSSDGLADVMEVAVTSGAQVYADTTFSDLFDWGEVALGALPAQSSQTYEFTAFLNPAVGNAYQQAELRFDLLIGFSGGEMVNDTTISRGGGGGGGSNFSLFNESVEVVDDTTARLTWDTNRSATSYAVCGNEDDGPFTLDPDARFFGYTFASTEDTATVRTHSVDFTDLSSGIYLCRVASREDIDDDFTVSRELQFAITPAGLVEGIADSQPFIQGNIFQPTPSVAGASTGGKGAHLTYEEYRAQLDAMKLAREANAPNIPTLTTTTRSQPIADTPPAVDASDSDQNNRNYWPFALVALVILGAGWWFTRLRRGANY